MASFQYAKSNNQYPQISTWLCIYLYCSNRPRSVVVLLLLEDCCLWLCQVTEGCGLYGGVSEQGPSSGPSLLLMLECLWACQCWRKEIWGSGGREKAQWLCVSFKALTSNTFVFSSADKFLPLFSSLLNNSCGQQVMIIVWKYTCTLTFCCCICSCSSLWVFCCSSSLFSAVGIVEVGLGTTVRCVWGAPPTTVVTGDCCFKVWSCAAVEKSELECEVVTCVTKREDW